MTPIYSRSDPEAPCNKCCMDNFNCSRAVRAMLIPCTKDSEYLGVYVTEPRENDVLVGHWDIESEDE